MKFIQIVSLGLLLLATQTRAQDSANFPARLPKLKPGEAVATFAGGCFWAQEEGFQQLRGVREVISGYSGGSVKNPTYEQVTSDQTGHAESVQVYYDPAIVSYSDLLDAFFAGHDPTTLNRQGPDAGRDYRSVAFYRTPAEKEQIAAAIARVNKTKHYAGRVVTEVMPFVVFMPQNSITRIIAGITPISRISEMCRCPK